MTNRQLIKNYLKTRYPVGTEIEDPVRSTHVNGPFVVKKNSVFEIFSWTAEDYSDRGRPDNPDDYIIELLVRNPGKESPNYRLQDMTINDINRWMKRHEEWIEKERNTIKLINEAKTIKSRTYSMLKPDGDEAICTMYYDHDKNHYEAYIQGAFDDHVIAQSDTSWGCQKKMLHKMQEDGYREAHVLNTKLAHL